MASMNYEAISQERKETLYLDVKSFSFEIGVGKEFGNLGK